MKKVTLKDNTDMLVLKEDRGISKELDETGVHEPRCSDFIKDYIEPGMVCYDIGANIGYYALMELARVGQEGLVCAFEPVPSNYSCLKANIEMYNYTNVRLFNIALGDENTIKKMTVGKFSNSSTMVEESSQWYKDWVSTWETGEIEVEQWGLDDFRTIKQLPMPNLLRMDVEGYEEQVIVGAQKTLKDMPSGSLLFIEFHPPVFKDPAEVMGRMLHYLRYCDFVPVWADGKDDFKNVGEFIEWACDPVNHCPHTFLRKI